MQKAIIFDMDGLMLDTERIALSTWQQAATAHGWTLTEELYVRLVGMNMARTRALVMQELGENYPFDQIEQHRVSLVYEYIQANGVPVKPGLFALLELLKERNIPRAVATSTARPDALSLLEKAGILPYFDTLVCGDEVTHSKPDPEIFLKAAAKLGVEPKNCAVLEDSFAGITGAHGAGMLPLMVPDLKPPTDEIKKLTHRIFPSLEEATVFLKGWLET